MLGRRADSLLKLYLAGDSKGRQEMESLIESLWHKHLSGGDSGSGILLPPPPQSICTGEYPIGRVVYADSRLHPFELRRDDLTQHLLIAGDTGAGKTNLIFLLVGQFLIDAIPFWLFDWKRVGRRIYPSEHCKEVLLFTVGGSASPFHWNFLTAPPGVSEETWLGVVVDVLCETHFLGHGARMLLEEALRQSKPPVSDKSQTIPGRWRIRDAYETLKKMNLNKGRTSLWAESVLRTLHVLSTGKSAPIYNIDGGIDPATLLDRSVIFELELNAQEKVTFMTLLLSWLYHCRLHQKKSKGLRQEIIIDEAHHAFLRRDHLAESSSEPVTDLLLREARELGMGFILADQFPSKLTHTVFGVGTKIILGLGHRMDVQMAADALLLGIDERDWLGRLPVGHAIVKLRSRFPSPFLISIPLMQLRLGEADEALIASRMASLGFAPAPAPAVPDSADTGPTQASPGPIHAIPPLPSRDGRPALQAPAPRNESPAVSVAAPPVKPSATSVGSKDSLTLEERAFLDNVLHHPFIGIAERFESLGLSGSRGNRIKSKLLDAGLLKEVDILDVSGRIKLLEPTPKGCSNVPLHPCRRGGLVHRYWIHRVGEALKNQGWKVSREHDIGGGCAIDLMAERPGKGTGPPVRIGVEIETGQSDVAANLRKCERADLSRLYVLAVHDRLAPSMERQVLDLGRRLKNPSGLRLLGARAFLRQLEEGQRMRAGAKQHDKQENSKPGRRPVKGGSQAHGRRG